MWVFNIIIQSMIMVIINQLFRLYLLLLLGSAVAARDGRYAFASLPIGEVIAITTTTITTNTTTTTIIIMIVIIVIVMSSELECDIR